MKTEVLIPTENLVIKVEEDTRFVLDMPANSNVSLHLKFEKSGVEAEIIGLYRLEGSETLNLTTIAHHLVPHTKCTTNIRGVLLGNSFSGYTGKIVIEKPAQQTVSYLDDKVLVLGKGSKNSSKPILEIEADDVKASHGATTGGIDQLQLFYLKSRGLTEKEAENVIVKGFFKEIMGDIPAEVSLSLLKKLKV